MPSESVPSLGMMGFVLLCVAMFFVVTAFGLRLSCAWADGLGRWTGRYEPIGDVSYRHALGIVLLPVVVLSLASSVEEYAIQWASHYSDESALRAAAAVGEWTAFAALVAYGLSTLQPKRNRLVLLAAALHVALVIGGGWALVSIVATLR